MGDSGHRRLILCVLTFVAFCPVAAYANPIVGPLSTVWPTTFFLIIPIVLIEVIYSRHRLQLKFWSAVHVIGMANLLSLLAGFPFGLFRSGFPMKGVSVFAGLLFALFFSYVLACWVEARWVLRYMRRTDRSDVISPTIVRETVRTANLLSYLFVSLVLVALLSLR